MTMMFGIDFSTMCKLCFSAYNTQKFVYNHCFIYTHRIGSENKSRHKIKWFLSALREEYGFSLLLLTKLRHYDIIMIPSADIQLQKILNANS